MQPTDRVFAGCTATASDICHQAGVLTGILLEGETYSENSLATCMFHLEGLLQEEATQVSKSVLSHKLAARIAPAFGIPFPVVSEIAIEAAVAAERERCAKIAESCATKEGEDWNDNPGQGAWDSACDHIAERIRAAGKD